LRVFVSHFVSHMVRTVAVDLTDATSERMN
jgi:hypothetical protein